MKRVFIDLTGLREVIAVAVSGPMSVSVMGARRGAAGGHLGLRIPQDGVRLQRGASGATPNVIGIWAPGACGTENQEPLDHPWTAPALYK